MGIPGFANRFAPCHAPASFHLQLLATTSWELNEKEKTHENDISFKRFLCQLPL
jgi:hypothetical protein